jgi:Sulfatase
VRSSRSLIGPFDRWPSPGGGFEHFYGFIAGETNQWYPALYENTTPVEPWGTPEDGYHLMPDLADKATARPPEGARGHPADAELTERHEEIPAWEDMDDQLKPVLAREMEVWSGPGDGGVPAGADGFR